MHQADLVERLQDALHIVGAGAGHGPGDRIEDRLGAARDRAADAARTAAAGSAAGDGSGRVKVDGPARLGDGGLGDARREMRGAGLAELRAGRVAQRVAEQSELVLGRGDDRHPSDEGGFCQIDAELLGDVARHLGDADLEHDLLVAGDGEHVDDLGRVAGEARGKVLGARRIRRARHVAGEHDIVVEARDLDVGAGDVGMDHRAEIAGVLLDADVEGEDLVSRRVEEEGVGLAGLLAQQEDAARRAHHGVDDLGVRDQDVAGVGIELDHRALALAEHHAAVVAAVVVHRDVDDARIGVVDRGHRLGVRGDERETGDGRQRDQELPRHSIALPRWNRRGARRSG